MKTFRRGVLAAAFASSFVVVSTLAQGQTPLPTCADLLTLQPLAGNPAAFSATATPLTAPAPDSRG